MSYDFIDIREGSRFRKNKLSLYDYFGCFLLLFLTMGAVSSLFCQEKISRALSLRVLEQRTKDCLKKGFPLAEDLKNLAGLKRIDGFLIDKENKDCILFGKSESNFGSLYLDDFVIAVRNSWQGSEPPGCSIDPREEDLTRIQKLAHELMTIQNPELLKEKLSKWRNMPGMQDVRVFGVPRNSNFAKTMVEADYLLKRIVDGTYPIKIKGFKSFSDLEIEEVNNRLKRGETAFPPLLIAMRFWFYPGENRFVGDEGIIVINKCEVRLLTEEEFLTRTGKMIGSGRANPTAETFINLFNRLYQEISEIETIYRDLENLYRFVALARLLKESRAYEICGLDLNFWINKFSIREYKIPATLPYIANVRELNFRLPVSGGLMIGYLCLPSCGGVSINIKIEKENILKDKTGTLLKMKRMILRSRPSADSLLWDFEKKEAIQETIKMEPIKK